MFCEKCGQPCNDNESFCAACGAAASGAQPQVKSDNSKIFCILAYLNILWVVGLFVSPEKDMPRVRFHVGQGILLTIISYAGGIVLSIISTIFGLISPILGLLAYLLTGAFGIVMLVLVIMGIMNVVNDKDVELPIVGKFAFYK